MQCSTSMQFNISHKLHLFHLEIYINGCSHIFYDFTRRKVIKTITGFYITTIEFFQGYYFLMFLLCHFCFYFNNNQSVMYSSEETKQK